jgi:predicted transcriptional regulator
MSIHPEFAEAILNGEKTVEFRKRRIAEDVTHIAIYVTQPVSAIVGVFEVEGQLTTSPRRLWRAFHDAAGISRRHFFEYFGARDRHHRQARPSLRRTTLAHRLDRHMSPPAEFPVSQRRPRRTRAQARWDHVPRRHLGFDPSVIG